MGSQQHGFRSGIIRSAVLAALLTALAPTRGWADFGAPVTLSSLILDNTGPNLLGAFTALNISANDLMWDLGGIISAALLSILIYKFIDRREDAARLKSENPI